MGLDSTTSDAKEAEVGSMGLDSATSGAKEAEVASVTIPASCSCCATATSLPTVQVVSSTNIGTVDAMSTCDPAAKAV